MAKVRRIGRGIGLFLALGVGTGPACGGRSQIVEPTPAPRIAVSLSEAAVRRFDVLELTIAAPGQDFANVWTGPAIEATFTPTAGGKSYRTGGFYHSAGVWKVRFAPPEAGRWRWALDWRTASGVQTASGEFDSLPSTQPGFVRRHPTNPFRLVFETGALYPAIGIGDCMVDDDKSGSPIDNWGFDGGIRVGHEAGRVTDLDTYMAAHGGAGFNLFRWSVDNCAFKLWEQIDPRANIYLEPEGRFGDTLAAALRRHGFRIYFTMFNAPPFPTDSGDAGKMAAVKAYVKYVVDRYGAYVDVWELMNEYPPSGPGGPGISPEWYTIVADYLRSVDPYQHMISTSWERPDLERIDINSPHWYEAEAELDSDLVTSHTIRRAKASSKPVIFGEQGNTGRNWDDRSGVRMRIRSWTAFFEEATLIFWNTSFARDYTNPDAANLYLGPEERGYIRVLQDFTGRVDPGVQPFAFTAVDRRVRAYGLRSSDGLYGYFHHFASRGPVAASVSVDVAAPGTAVWIDPSTGVVLSSTSLGIGRQTLLLPTFSIDLALRLQPLVQ